MNRCLARWKPKLWWTPFICYFLIVEADFIRPDAALRLWITLTWYQRLWNGVFRVWWPIGCRLSFLTFLKSFIMVTWSGIISKLGRSSSYRPRYLALVRCSPCLIKKLLGWFLAIPVAEMYVLRTVDFDMRPVVPTLIQVGWLAVGLVVLLGVRRRFVDFCRDLNRVLRGLLIAHVVSNYW